LNPFQTQWGKPPGLPFGRETFARKGQARRPTLLSFAIFCLALSGCSGEKSPEAATLPAGPLATPDEVNGATLTGKVSFTGPKPTSRPIDMSANPQCERNHKGHPMVAEDVVVNGNGTLRNVFVWIKIGVAQRNWAAPTAAVEIDQKDCMYRPRVIGAMVGQNIRISNSDPVNHNIHPIPQINEEWNDTQSTGEAPKLWSFSKQEVAIPVKCNVHPWMRSYIGVVSHPFFAVTGEDGSFTIKGLAPGTYTLQTWHEKFGTQEQQVTVGSKESKTIHFSYKG
jgi:plastocyanin